MARTDAKAFSPSRIPARKGSELLGILLLTAAMLLLASLLTYRPDDPSLLHQGPEGSQARNLIGPVGAEIGALSFSLFGLPAFLLPGALFWAGWRKLRGRAAARVVGRGLGISLALAVLPPLTQLLLGAVSWRGFDMDAGGVLGRLLVGALNAKLHVVGTFLALAAGLAVGVTLAVQSSLEEIAGLWWLRLRSLGERLRLAWARWRERRHKDRARRRVVSKHIQRARERRANLTLEAAPAGAAAGANLRVVERSGEKRFGVRRIRARIEAKAEQPEPRGVADQLLDQPPTPAARAAVRSVDLSPTEESAVVGGGQQSLPLPKPVSSRLPPINLLDVELDRHPVAEDHLIRLGERICQRCEEFGVHGTIEGISPGPVITVFELQPAPGVKVSQIVNLQDDLALALKAEAIRIDRLPGRSTLGIEVPNAKRSVIRLGPLLADSAFKKAPSPLTMAIGRTLQGEPYFVDLATMPHLLVAGATGAGKSVGLQSMITSILYKASREEVQFIFIDPKRIELGVYANIPHLKAPVVVEPKKAANALRWAVAEMERRYRLLAEVHVRSIDYYNRAIRDPEVQKRLSLRDEEGESEVTGADLSPLPYYVVIIDELADLMMVASSDVEMAIARLAQMARAVGIHLIVATQRPSVDVLTGTIKANFPCRMAYATATRHDSRTILDQVGAEKLLGKGDMLFMPPGSSRTVRLHGAFLSEQETAALVRWLKRQGKPEIDPAVLEPPVDERGDGVGGAADDVLFDEAARLVVAEQQASASFLQRRMRVGYSRAARLIDMMEQDGLLGPSQGSKGREILVPRDYFTELDEEKG